MECKKVHFSGHATVQMFKRRILVEDIETVIKAGMIIKDYPDDNPYPSQIWLFGMLILRQKNKTIWIV